MGSCSSGLWLVTAACSGMPSTVCGTGLGMTLESSEGAFEDSASETEVAVGLGEYVKVVYESPNP